VEIWLAVFTLWALGTAMIRLLFVTPTVSTSNVGIWRFLRAAAQRRGSADDATLLGPRAARNLLQRAANAERAHVRHLRPRLQELAAYYLPINHGIDPDRSPERAAALLGGLYWLIDDSVVGRTPTPTEIEQFLDVVVGDHDNDRVAERAANAV
jgi:hypothetical protein